MKDHSILSTFILGFVIALVFIGLKLADIVSWTWVWVLSPIWIPLLFLTIAVILNRIIMKWIGE